MGTGPTEIAGGGTRTTTAEWVRSLARLTAGRLRAVRNSGRLGAAASLAAGVLWLLVWLHQREAHGTTEVNEERVVLGLTWLDSAKFLAAPLALLVPAFAALYRRRGHVGALGRAGFAATMAALGALVVATAVQYWSFPWGSYAVDYDAPPRRVGEIAQNLAALVFAVGLALFTVDLARARVMPPWAAPVLVLGGLATFWFSPAWWLPGVAWLLLAWLLWSRRGRGHPATRTAEPGGLAER
jgi:hypothetical protein